MEPGGVNRRPLECHFKGLNFLRIYRSFGSRDCHYISALILCHPVSHNIRSSHFRWLLGGDQSPNKGDPCPPVELTKRAVNLQKPREKLNCLRCGFEGLRCPRSSHGRNVVDHRISARRSAAGPLGSAGYKLGDVGELTPDEARKAARTALSKVRLGADPDPPSAKLLTPADDGRGFGGGIHQEHAEAKCKRSTAVNYRTCSANRRSRTGHLQSRYGYARKHRPAAPEDAKRLLTKPTGCWRLLGHVHLCGLQCTLCRRGSIPSAASAVPGIRARAFPDRRRTRSPRGALREAETMVFRGPSTPQRLGQSMPPKEENRSKGYRLTLAPLFGFCCSPAADCGKFSVYGGTCRPRTRCVVSLRQQDGSQDCVLNAPAMAVLRVAAIGTMSSRVRTRGPMTEKPRADLKRPWEAVRPMRSSMACGCMTQAHVCVIRCGGRPRTAHHRQATRPQAGLNNRALCAPGQ